MVLPVCEWYCGPVCGPAEIIGQSASVKMPLIMVTPISKRKLDPVVHA